jgi:hypothetical protein
MRRAKKTSSVSFFGALCDCRKILSVGAVGLLPRKFILKKTLRPGQTSDFHSATLQKDKVDFPAYIQPLFTYVHHLTFSNTMATETPEPTTDPVEETPEVADELDDEDFDDVAPPPEDDAVPEAPATEEPEAEAPEDEVDEEDSSTVEPAPKEKAMDDTPDFSQYKTNVYERLFRAKKAAEGTDVDYSINLVTRTEEYQAWRTKMALLTKYIDEYSTAMKTVSEKRDQVSEKASKMYVEFRGNSSFRFRR